MEFPKITTAITPESSPGEQILHYVRENGEALCGLTALFSDDDRPDVWWPMGEAKAFRLMYRTCYDCTDAHRVLSDQWMEERRARPSLLRSEGR